MIKKLCMWKRLYVHLVAVLALPLVTMISVHAYEVDAVLDRFDGNAINADRWNRASVSRRIENGQLVMTVSTSSQTKQSKRNRILATQMPVTAIESTITLTQLDLSARNAEYAFGRIDGVFYTTEATSTVDNHLGDVWAGLFVGDNGNGLRAWHVIEKSTNSDSSTVDVVVANQLIPPGTLQMNTPYPVKIAYDGDNSFEFIVNGVSSGTVNGPARGTASARNSVRCTTGVNLSDDGDDFPIRAEARFDDVKLNDSAAVYDDFSGVDDHIDLTKWKGIDMFEAAEISRNLSSGKMNMTVVGQSGQADAANYIDGQYSDTSYLEAKVTMLPGDLPPGIEGLSRLTGYWYNQLPPALQDHRKGNIWAQFMLLKEADGQQRVVAFIAAVTDQFHNVRGDRLLLEPFNSPFSFNQEHTLSIRLDESNKQLIFTFDTESYAYDITSDIYPVPEGNHKSLQVQMESGSGTVQALFDDVRIGIDSPFTDAAPLSHQQWVEAMANNDISTGCGGTLFCPEMVIPRSAASIWLLRAIEGGSYTPPIATGTIFGDVNASDLGADFIEELNARSITEGCNAAGTLFCPGESLTKVQSALWILKALNKPPTLGATGTMFSDVGMNDFGAAWIEQLYREGIADGCEPDKFCPNASVSTAGFAKMLSKAFNLTP